MPLMLCYHGSHCKKCIYEQRNTEQGGQGEECRKSKLEVKELICLPTAMEEMLKDCWLWSPCVKFVPSGKPTITIFAEPWKGAARNISIGCLLGENYTV